MKPTKSFLCVPKCLRSSNWNATRTIIISREYQKRLYSTQINSELNEEKFLHDAATHLKIKQLNDWYSVTAQDLRNLPGASNFTISHPLPLLTQVYPQHEWLPWKFLRCPRNFWSDFTNHKKFVDWAGKQLGIKEMSGWYKDFVSIGGSPLLFDHYSGSISQMLSKVYPEYEWLPWEFYSIRKNYFDDVNNQRKFVNWAGKELKIKEMSDWYKVTVKDLNALKGSYLISFYNGCVANLLKTVYPEYEWLPWRFVKSPKNYWFDVKNQRKFMDWAGNQLGIKELNDWIKVSKKVQKFEIFKLIEKDLMSLNVHLFSKKFSPSYEELLMRVYPEHSWNFPASLKSKTPLSKKTQHLLKSMLKTIFPHNEILEEYKHPDIVSSDGKPLELDLFYPSLAIAFEYQGIQHFQQNPMFHKYANTLEESKNRDQQKMQLCKQQGITLIEVPYWWDRKYETLAATIYRQCPELFSERPNGIPISLTPPTKSVHKRSSHKHLMLATEWDYESMDPSGWYMTEKYDGMRLYWNGSDFYSRQGNKVKVPESLKMQLPSGICLDGELWTKYGLYQDAVALCVNTDEEKWKKAVYWVFDAPDIADKPYEERMKYLQELKDKQTLPSFVNIVQSVKCESREHLKQYFDSIIAKGGEGVMLSEPGSVYKVGRSASLRKYKPYFDTEVKVVENHYPHGFKCIQVNGKEVFVGLSDNYDDAKKVKNGSIITVKHQGANIYGTLQYPKFYRERIDVLWDDLIKT